MCRKFWKENWNKRKKKKYVKKYLNKKKPYMFILINYLGKLIFLLRKTWIFAIEFLFIFGLKLEKLYVL